MGQKKGANTWEYGDFQTPVKLAQKACSHLRKFNPDFQPRTIIESSCGTGAFLFAAADAYPDADRFIGIDIEAEYLNVVRTQIADRKCSERFHVREGDFFTMDWESVLSDLPGPFLVIGNPPWVTSSDIGRLKGKNLPEKSNFQQYTGIEALTGMSNFDISEWMMLQKLEWIVEYGGCLGMLCKTSVARKIMRQAWRKSGVPVECRMVRIDALQHFAASVDACFFSMKIVEVQGRTDCEWFHDFEDLTPANVLGYHNGIMLSHVDRFHEYVEFLGTDSHYTWRSGVKHDSSKVMELRQSHGILLNGYGDQVEIEDLCLFPLLKSSDLSNGRIHDSGRQVILTQKKVGQPTDYIHDTAPMTWRYLKEHSATLEGRRSSIYRNKPRFSIFGVGGYTFSDWKVAISGFYKSLNFQVVGPIDGKPVVFDSTIYFLSANTKAEAEFLTEILNSKPCKDFLESMIFWSDKRPITADLLKRIDLCKVAQRLGRGDEYDRFTELKPCLHESQ